MAGHVVFCIMLCFVFNLTHKVLDRSLYLGPFLWCMCWWQVDCDDHKLLCSKYGVTGFPTIKCFPTKSLEPKEYDINLLIRVSTVWYAWFSMYGVKLMALSRWIVHWRFYVPIFSFLFCVDWLKRFDFFHLQLFRWPDCWCIGGLC